jgi:hypothetical protein
MTKCAIRLAVALFAASSAFAQVDAFSLRSKYGPPLDRETFTVLPGIEMVVDYGPGRQACRIQLPSGMRIAGTVPPGTITKQQTDQVLGEVLPPSIRGKEMYRMMEAMGMQMVFLTEYENVTIGEMQMNNPAIGTGITVTFKDPACPKKTDREVDAGTAAEPPNSTPSGSK